ncbi:BglG family transcription antiterminator LicT [Romboutsia sp. 1001216sp1]|uniref:BglG family transcription antiterminator LicT n=1 Tax=Romboutsia sp. 1001216sp1 TaxID=2986997 RepID=UPI00232EA35E|nr:PRD domain-containing protein [Romboutsia sp. 1001216sp1]MDB8804649.1 PRD domain-containing protein [Romboutsia sp. 1001216sp1]MDB8806427.1 PRD domain-containing protein [Romboutsia sp. 1001216sp1]MDB8810297.1 PRD domain-containing protein [Romboutsia sp. 1001216sp1]MDB8816044.1 PRD domain-containing protein [Romboutsia sp. 1001216sp1]MDB8818494.1 PRD domain-containing protein [Romboutsia sp. 1001216sp1]
MLIQKIYNNNVVLVVDDETNKELVLTGCGIGFKKKVGEKVDQDKIEKKFVMEDENLAKKITRIATEVDEDIFNVTSKIIEYAKQNLNAELDDYIYVALADHISFAIKRYNQNIEIKNDLLYEIKRIHKKEFQIGIWAIDYINKEFNVNFTKDEAAFIAMHIINANYKESTKESFLMTKIVKEILNIIRYYYSVEFKEDDFNYDRLVTHLKFFAKRLIKKEQVENNDNELLEIIKIQYEKPYNCSCKIKKYIEDNHEYIVTEDELLYLTLHINRVIAAIK